MEKLVKDFLKQKRFAIAGSFKNENKYAYKILKTLIKKGYEAYPVNPRINNVNGIKCYKRISDIPLGVDVVSLVTPSLISEAIVKECAEQAVEKIWLQPGAESEKAIKFCHDNGMNVIHGLCVMLESL